MINSPVISTFALLVQAAQQPVTEPVIVSPLEATSAWIDDCIALWVLGY